MIHLQKSLKSINRKKQFTSKLVKLLVATIMLVAGSLILFLFEGLVTFNIYFIYLLERMSDLHYPLSINNFIFTPSNSK